MPDLYLPGYGVKSSDEIDIDILVRKHDSDLSFRRNDDNGTYTVFQRLMRDSAYSRNADAIDDLGVVRSDSGTFIPVHSFGHTLPSTETVQKWLWEADSWRQDHVEQCRRHNAAIKAENQRKHAEITHEASERVEFAFRKNGVDTGVIKSFRKDGKRRRTF